MLSGKSTALAVWRQAGAYVLSCDELVREISARPALQKKIKEFLGTTDRVQLAQRVFSNLVARRKLEHLVHPVLFAEIRKRLRASKQTVRVVEAPLLFEAGWEEYFDLTMALFTPEKQLAVRAKKRGISRADWKARQRAQLPQAQKAARADICILNNGPAKDLSKKIAALHWALTKIYNVK